ncbi:hypothetical protein [Sphingomonas montanisoli]|uniref:Uncharacterized protein n=1 Tax=Sphingomonas montanisoli TaxID=2606412 RepID=A0A5D9CCH1_9SPHN|nr:hypothetical protein [Sphingomonas montanisoli]TZG28720.1 hypothetical protein FYJ91_00800 [Sphingomonas montanisoli]
MDDTPDDIDSGHDPDARPPSPRDPVGDVRPSATDPDPHRRVGREQEDSEDSPSASTVMPEDDPEEGRADSSPDGV